MIPYNHDIIQVNNRPIRLTDILNEHVSIQSSFEKDTFFFIRQWFSNTYHFQFETSGSTGLPKNISFSREQIVISAKATIKALNLLSSETSLLCLPSKYIAGKMMLVRSFVNQMKIVISEPSSNPLKKIDPAIQPDFVALVPLQLETMLEAEAAEPLNKIKNIIIGGTTINTILRQKIIERLSTNVFATFGMTETLSHIALENITAGDGTYKPLPGVELNLDARGCLIIKAPFCQHPIRTNDVVEIIPDNGFRWLGRWDNLINTGGVKVIPEILEDRIRKIFDRLNIQRRFFIAGISDTKLGQRISLIMEGQPLDNALQESVKAEIVNNFIKFEIPREFIFLDQFIETETGKINRRESLKMACK